MSSQEPIRRSARARSRGPLIGVDLNVAPPCESRSQEGTSSHGRIQDTQTAVAGGTAQPPPIDVEALDDDVVISSPRAFAEAKKNQRRTFRRNRPVVDVEAVERTSRNKRRRNQTVINCDLYINLEARNTGMLDRSPRLPPSQPPHKEPELSCPICMGPFVEEMTTKCGHIFCKACIKTAIATQAKCPTCRRRTTARDIIRIYLPSTRASGA